MYGIYEIGIEYYNGEVPRTRVERRIYGKELAIDFAKKVGECENVYRADLIDALTGELILVIENQKVVWQEGAIIIDSDDDDYDSYSDCDDEGDNCGTSEDYGL